MTLTDSARPAPTGDPPPRLGPLSLRMQVVLGLCILAGCLLPAVLNRYPLVFPDTDGYLLAAWMFRPSHVRGFGYGAFLRMTGGLISLWLPILAQAALAAWLSVRVIALEAPNWPATWRLPAVVGLTALLLAGHLPWISSWVQPDVFSGLMLLALWLLALHWTALGGTERALLFLVLAGAVTTHLTHPPLLLGLAGFALVLSLLAPARRVRLRLGPAAAPRWVPTGAVLRRAALVTGVAAALGWGMLVTANLITYRVPTASLGGSVFLFARLQADTDAAGALRPHCAEGRSWAVCDQLDRLGLSADDFLWRDWSPLPQLGQVGQFSPEAAELNPILLRHGWPAWLARSAERAVLQMLSVELGDGLDTEGPTLLREWVKKHGIWYSRLVERVADTRQAVDGIRPLLPRLLTEPLAVLGLLLLAGLAVYGLRRRQPSLWWPALLVLGFWAGNAALIALGGEVHSRYSARVLCVVPLLAGVVALRALAPKPAPAARSLSAEEPTLSSIA